MALCMMNMTRRCLGLQARNLHTSTASWGIFDILSKPMPTDEASAVGYKKIIIEAKKAGEDPLEVEDRHLRNKVAGSGSKSDPFIVPSRNTRRYVIVEPPEHHGGPMPGFWVTLENGGRCPLTARYYKLDYDPSDKWGIDELDLFKH